MKVIFLDVDGVLNSLRTVYAYGGYPFPDVRDGGIHDVHNVDPIAIKMVLKLIKRTGAKVVLHSTWRNYMDDQEFTEVFGIPIYNHTEVFIGKPRSIVEWLEKHPEVTTYVILDDDNMYDEIHQVWVNGSNGLSLEDLDKARKILGE